MQAPPPPAYTGNPAPPPAYAGTPAPTPQAYDNQAYNLFWRVLYCTLITWIFAVSATANGAGVAFFSTYCDYYTSFGSDDFFDNLEEACDLASAVKATQIVATVLVSLVLLVVAVAAFSSAPMTSHLGLAAGILLALFAVFELIAFSCMAAFSSKLNSFFAGAGVFAMHTLALAIIACFLGAVGAGATLYLRKRAITGRDGPFKSHAVAFKESSKADAAAAPAAAPAPTATV